MSTDRVIPRLIDRRAFLGGTASAAGVTVAATLLPCALIGASPSLSAPVVAATENDAGWAGHVDDACGHWPPYSHPIPYGVGRQADVVTALAQIDAASGAAFDYILTIG